MYHRLIIDKIKSKSHSGKIILLVGPRQVGKTTLIKEQFIQGDYLFLDADDPSVRKVLDTPNTEEIKNIIGKHNLLFIDEAQRIPNIGLTLKIIADQIKQVQVLVSGSSSFDLANELNEPLTGRKWEYNLLPISWEEYEDKHGYLKAQQQLENRLLYGFYPEVLNNPGSEIEILKQLTDSYLYKDILAYANIRKSEVLEKLVLALALQVGSEVNYNELSQTVGVDKNTIVTYIDVLQKGYVIFKLNAYSGNIRNEIKKSKKIYFYDTGIRNMIIGNFNRLSLRQDVGAIWENFLVAERMKQNLYKETYSKTYFWRTKQQQEVDFVEVNNGNISGFEFKWNTTKSVRLPRTFVNAYNAQEHLITPDNFRDFVLINK